MSMKGKRLLLLGGTNSWEEIKEFSVKNHITLIATGPYSDTMLKRISSSQILRTDLYGDIRIIADKKGRVKVKTLRQ